MEEKQNQPLQVPDSKLPGSQPGRPGTEGRASERELVPSCKETAVSAKYSGDGRDLERSRHRCASLKAGREAVRGLDGPGAPTASPAGLCQSGLETTAWASWGQQVVRNGSQAVPCGPPLEEAPGAAGAPSGPRTRGCGKGADGAQNPQAFCRRGAPTDQREN